MLRLGKIKKEVTLPDQSQKTLLHTTDLTIAQGDFITVLGGNGAGKSTLLNLLAGTLLPSSGQIYVNEQAVTNWSEVKRAKYLARVFQDPKLGTASRLTVAENLLLAQKRGQHRSLRSRKLKQSLPAFAQLCAEVGNGLEQHLHTPTGQLSGGQRQALSLLMATMQRPEILLLDEHTAALDPKTAQQLMQLTQKRVTEQQLTCVMITHQMHDALAYGNRLIVLNQGRIIHDFHAEEKAKLTPKDLLEFFEFPRQTIDITG